jgi:hypothetical protein
MISTISPAGYWDNGTAGNYWSDYLVKYPNASDVDILGIGDMPYLIESNSIKWSSGSGTGITIAVEVLIIIRSFTLAKYLLKPSLNRLPQVLCPYHQ